MLFLTQGREFVLSRQVRPCTHVCVFCLWVGEQEYTSISFTTCWCLCACDDTLYSAQRVSLPVEVFSALAQLDEMACCSDDRVRVWRAGQAMWRGLSENTALRETADERLAAFISRCAQKTHRVSLGSVEEEEEVDEEEEEEGESDMVWFSEDTASALENRRQEYEDENDQSELLERTVTGEVATFFEDMSVC